MDKIVNIDEKNYYDGKGYEVDLYPGAGAEYKTFYAFANNEETALENVVAYCDQNGLTGFITPVDVEIDRIKEDYKKEYDDFIKENPDATEVDFITEYLNETYVDATSLESGCFFIDGLYQVEEKDLSQIYSEEHNPKLLEQYNKLLDTIDRASSILENIDDENEPDFINGDRLEDTLDDLYNSIYQRRDSLEKQVKVINTRNEIYDYHKEYNGCFKRIDSLLSKEPNNSYYSKNSFVKEALDLLPKDSKENFAEDLLQNTYDLQSDDNKSLANEIQEKGAFPVLKELFNEHLLSDNFMYDEVTSYLNSNTLDNISSFIMNNHYIPNVEEGSEEDER